jgi:serine/threonine protein kinase
MSESAASTGNRFRIIGRFHVSGVLGHGAMGTVYRGEDPLIGRTVALKVLSTELQPLLGEAEMREFHSHFLREAKAAGRLNHPNIVTIYDVGEYCGMPYIAMEFVPGLSLREYLDSGVVLPVRRIVEIGILVARGLDYAHQNEVVHRDIKPANLMLGRKGVVKIMDFGIARAPGRSEDGKLQGSPRYMAPEQIADRPVGPTTDVHALGVTLYEALTGKLPFDAPDFRELADKVLHQEPPRPSTLNPDVPEGLDAIVMQALAKEPSARFRNMRAMAKALSAVRAELKRGEEEPPAGEDIGAEFSDPGLDQLQLAGSGSRLREELRRHLTRLALTRELDGPEQDSFGAHLLLYLVPPGHILFREGEASSYLGLLLEGDLAVTKRGVDGQEQQLELLGPGMPFGEMSLLDAAPRSATLTALGACQIAVLSRRHFRRLCRERPELSVKLLLALGGLLTQRLRRTSDRLAHHS